MMKQMTTKWMAILLLGSLVGLSACSDDNPSDTGGEIVDENDTGKTDAGHDEPDSESEGTPDVDDESDAENGTPDVDDEEDATETCTPTVDACSADICGDIDNGCGEILDCGACPCDGGTVVEESCGTCALGVRTCGTD